MDRMLTARPPVVALVSLCLGLVAIGACAQDKAPPPAAKPVSAQPAAKPAAKPAAANPTAVAVPADVKARVVSKLQGAKPSDVAATPIPGLYEVTMGGLIAYVSADGKFLVSGNIYDLDTEVNLTAARRNDARAKALAGLREDQMIIFSPEKPKMTVTVFTDVDCGYCRKFHSHIADLNKAGVRVRYMLFPRTGPGTEAWDKAEAVWCSPDRKEALSRAKRGEAVKAKPCGDAVVKSDFEMGGDLGVEGTPAIFTQTGDYIGGYLTPEQLVQAVQQAQKPETGSR
jgi:thiol:disulfide interchange protein DsbC